MKNTRRALAFLVAVPLALGLLAGCGAAPAAPGSSPSGNGPAGSSAVWKAERKKIDGLESYMDAKAVTDGKVYFSTSASWWDDDDKKSESIQLWSMQLEGGKPEKLAGYKSPTASEGLEDFRAQVSALAPSEAGLWLYETQSGTRYELPEGFSDTEDDKYEYAKELNTSRLCLIDPLTGEEKLSVELSPALEAVKKVYPEAGEQPGFNSMCSDAEGNLCLLYDMSAVVFMSAKGELLGAETLNGWAENVLRLSDGRAAVAGRNGGEFELLPVDFSAKALGKGIALPNNAGSVCFSGDKYSCGYRDDLYIYGFNAEKGDSVRLAGLLDCGIDENQLSGVYLGEDDIYCFVNDFDTGKTMLYRLTELAPEEAAKLVTLRLACNYLSPNLSKDILSFNTSSKTARIEVTDYSQYNTDEDFTAGITKLNTEIISGNVPDIFVTTGLPMQRYAAKGLIKDLYEFMDNDPELSRDSFMAPVLKAVETNGKLYSIAPGFSLITLVGKSDTVGKDMGWTLAEMQEVIRAHPEAKYIMGQGMTRDSVLDSMLRYGLDRYVNWETGECSFNTPDFIDVLKFSSLFSDEFTYDELSKSPYELLADGSQLLMPYELRDFRDFQTCVVSTKGEATFKGYPTAEGVGNLISFSSAPLSISATCRDTAAAWSFVRSMLTEDYFKSARYIDGLPLNAKAYDSAEAEAMKKETYTDPETGKVEEMPAGTLGWGDFTINFYAMTKEEAQALRGLIASTSRTAAYDKSIMDIINDELKAYTQGLKTAEQAAALIQDRVSLYVNEQR